MAMNRETKRMLQRQGSLDAAGDPVAPSKNRPAPKAPRPTAAEDRLPPHKWLMRYLREVRSEMSKVTFPSRDEVRSYSIMVFVFLVVVSGVVGLLDFGLSHLVLKIFD